MDPSMDACHDVPAACYYVPLSSHGLMEKELSSAPYLTTSKVAPYTR
jgi:hypothetical protein